MAVIRLESLTKDFGDARRRQRPRPDDPRRLVRRAARARPGCGKTTTMNMISGLETPTCGRDLLRRHADQPASPPGKRNVGFVFQNYAIFTHMTVLREPRLRAAGAQAAAAADRARRGGEAGRRDRRRARDARPEGRPPVGQRHAEGRARPLDDRRARDLPARRAVLEPRRSVPRVHARGAQAHPARDRPDDGLRHPRPGRGDGHGRSDRGHEPRRAPAVRAAGRALQPPANRSSPASSARR